MNYLMNMEAIISFILMQRKQQTRMKVIQKNAMFRKKK